MCGLAGIFAYADHAPVVDRDALLRTRDYMARRGPDGAGIWLSANQRIGLAHRRLAIIDLSKAGCQPMQDMDTGNQIVFNGEIYNYRSLRTLLEAAGQVFRTQSDTEVLLKLYAVKGRAMLPMLRGMFAFAIWDETGHGLFLARDPFGIKPLYLADDGRTLRFASQVKALLAGGGVDTEPNPAGHVGFYLWGHVPEPHTLYRGIRALPAGNSLWLERGGRRTNAAYFNLTTELAAPQGSTHCTKPEEAHEILRAALCDTVRHHLVADVPVGAFLSAGLDSATLVALTNEQFAPATSKPTRESIPGEANNNPFTALHTLTLGFKEFAGTENDEVPFAEIIAQHYSTQHRTIWVSQQDFIDEYSRLLIAMDQPSIDGVNSYFVCKAAREAGLKVALSGLGGDELFAGYSHFKTIPKMVRLLRPFAVAPILGKSVRLIGTPIVKHLTNPKVSGVLEYGGSYAGAYLLRRTLFMPWELPTVLDADMVQQGLQDLDTIFNLHETVEGINSARIRISAMEIGWYMRSQLLRDTDWASMAHSVEVRVPLVDIELFRTIAWLTHVGQPPSKQDMAACPSNSLPAEVLKRRKSGFSVPVKEWLLKSSAIKFSSASRANRTYAKYLIQNFQ